MEFLDKLNIKIFADGANKEEMLSMNQKNWISGLTTNPTLMKKAEIKNYKNFSKDILKHITNKPISFEVFSDDFVEMERQAIEISEWGDNVYVKIPITNTKSEPSYKLIEKLVDKKVKVNVTAIMTLEQVKETIKVLDKNIPSYISVFAGRIADTGRDPLPIMSSVIEDLKSLHSAELIWASPRELLNLFQADQIGCDIITMTSDIIKKFPFVGYSLQDYSLDTVKMFYNDALEAGYNI
jgi:transaldolase